MTFSKFYRPQELCDLLIKFIIRYKEVHFSKQKIPFFYKFWSCSTDLWPCSEWATINASCSVAISCSRWLCVTMVPSSVLSWSYLTDASWSSSLYSSFCLSDSWSNDLSLRAWKVQKGSLVAELKGKMQAPGYEFVYPDILIHGWLV